MQRVVSINLSGNAYQLEENGYNALFAYLDAADAQLKDNPDRARIRRSRSTGGRVVQRLPGAARKRSSPRWRSSASSPGSEPPQSAWRRRGPRQPRPPRHPGPRVPEQAAPPPLPPRRLYQIREGSMISGVCMGLAGSIHIDVTLIRIMFVVFALVTSGWGIMAYAALMFVVPRVETRAGASAHDASGPCRRITGRGTTGGRGTNMDGRGTNTDGRGISRGPGRRIHAVRSRARRSRRDPMLNSGWVTCGRRPTRRGSRRAMREANGAPHAGPRGWRTTR
jgi:phage shock protein PspC (stress-responsive transcriptional regulator)